MHASTYQFYRTLTASGRRPSLGTREKVLSASERDERKGKSSWTLTRLLLVSIAPSTTCVTVNKGASELLGELDGPVGTSKMANYFKSCALLRDRAKRYRDDS